ncbi:MAG: iron chelate uptake ABC transporter family permease subunit [Pseudomonas stutzeri]|nr:ABC-type Fe3 -siderophore transporter, permease component [Stutzerimonas stutzeri]NIM31656.1 iron chelate uptake ABC transporter family permease subunit [Stutzerimonas stutzeri]NIM55669.1 iron chelate uptake ABC transporter family permease subunit [Stutzerimonas stutzeri]NIM87105.1 iron chelate uptake ABC transporter family permease subunit [Stutzerimonas stutzeri]NIN81765.1 iron chelate uptake ABC transporter family permease subunit [Stutzerimonas stutzeri]
MPALQKATLVAGGGLLLVLLALSLATGAGVYGAESVLGYLLGAPEYVADDKLAMVVDTLRLPRTFAALVVGASLAIAASLLQSATRNPLAEPGLLGVNAGAVLGLVIGLIYFGVESTQGYLLWSGLGALLGNLGVLGIGLMLGQASPLKLILAGVALGAIFGGLANYLLLSTRVALEQFRFWNLGSLSASRLDALATVAPLAVLGLILAALLCRQLTLMQMGDSQARALGIHTSWVRLGVLAASTLLTACAISLAGPVGFVGFLAAYCARLLEPVALLRQLLFSTLFGMLFLLAADVLARWLLQPYELPVGTLLAALGAPALIVIVLRGGFRSLLTVR